MARIFGVSTPDIAACRVLELGCASGGNLIPMAFNLPRSEFVGVDLSRHQVDDGRSVIRDLGLSNIRIEHASILDIGPDFGTFDYIICHGVFSWVDEPVQEKILQVASDNLSASGVAYISYNTYPGWHMREGVRRMMRYHTRQFDEPQEQIDRRVRLRDVEIEPRRVLTQEAREIRRRRIRRVELGHRRREQKNAQRSPV